MSTLAIYGGSRVRTKRFPPRPAYGIAERDAANSVVASGALSGFLAEAGDSFLGGYHVRALEAAFCEKFGVRYAVAMNSGTSCLFAAVKTLGIGPGDEVIVTPWSMSASATCVLAAGAIPVFVDIEPDTYCLSYQSVGDRITSRTKAIVLVDLFGCTPRDLNAILSFDIPIIEDAAQAIGATSEGVYAGTFGEIGVFSLNKHKTIQCGEGGVAVTDNLDLAESLRAIRNHGEVLGDLVIGQNYRMGEIEAAIATVQLGRLEELTKPRIRNAWRLNLALEEMGGLTPPVVPERCQHVFYLYATRIFEKYPGLTHIALRREGIPVSRYVKPLYCLPVFGYEGRAYEEIRDRCPEAERAYREVIVNPLVHAGITDADNSDIIAAFTKIHEQAGRVRSGGER